jgi:hypothetical protein
LSSHFPLDQVNHAVEVGVAGDAEHESVLDDGLSAFAPRLAEG